MQVKDVIEQPYHWIIEFDDGHSLAVSKSGLNENSIRTERDEVLIALCEKIESNRLSAPPSGEGRVSHEFTDEQIQAWADRHNITDGFPDLRCMFEDARTLPTNEEPGRDDTMDNSMQRGGV